MQLSAVFQGSLSMKIQTQKVRNEKFSHNEACA